MIPNQPQQGWPPASAPQGYPPQGQYSANGPPPGQFTTGHDPNAVPVTTSAPMDPNQSSATNVDHRSSAATPVLAPDQRPALAAGDDWDFDFDGPIWPKSNEPVDPQWSLGVISMYPP